MIATFFKSTYITRDSQHVEEIMSFDMTGGGGVKIWENSRVIERTHLVAQTLRKTLRKPIMGEKYMTDMENIMLRLVSTMFAKRTQTIAYALCWS